MADAAAAGSRRVAGLKDLVSPAAKAKRLPQRVPIRRISLAWEPDFDAVRAGLGLRDNPDAH
jgi:hypothetical protein